jgi:hypothetical protein
MRFHFSDLFGRDRIRLHKERPAEARCGAPQGWPNHNDIGGIGMATNSLSPAERLKSAVFTLGAVMRSPTQPPILEGNDARSFFRSCDNLQDSDPPRARHASEAPEHERSLNKISRG